MSDTLSTIEIRPSAEHRYSIIWLHGLGANGHDFEAVVPMLQLVEYKHIHFVFPNAPIQPVTINGGMRMRAWFDVFERSKERKVDIGGIYRSSALLDALIGNEIAFGIPSRRILLAGFSQGGTIALHCGLRYEQPLAGILALSTYLPTLAQLPQERGAANVSTPIFMAHGRYDGVIDLDTAQQVCHGLQNLNYPVDWHEYPMQHALCNAEIAAISTFIRKVFAG